MGLMRVAEASAFDLLEALDDQGRPARFTRSRFGEASRQVAEGAAYTIRDPHGRLAAVAGLWPEADHLEAWLAAGPALGSALRPTLAAIRSLLDAAGPAAGLAEARAYVAIPARPAKRVAGARLAAWLGFKGVGVAETPVGPMQMFIRRFEAS